MTIFKIGNLKKMKIKISVKLLSINGHNAGNIVVAMLIAKTNVKRYLDFYGRL